MTYNSALANESHVCLNVQQGPTTVMCGVVANLSVTTNAVSARWAVPMLSEQFKARTLEAPCCIS